MALTTESGLDGEYVPSPRNASARRWPTYEASGGVEGGTLEGRPVVILTSVGTKSGKVRKNPVMRIVDGERYVAVASAGGSPAQPVLVRQSGCPPDGPTQDGASVREFAGPRGQRRREALLLGGRRAVLAAVSRISTLAGGRDIPIMVLEPIAPRTPVTPFVRYGNTPIPYQGGTAMTKQQKSATKRSFWRRSTRCSIGVTTLRRSGSGHLITSSTARTSSRDVRACSSL